MQGGIERDNERGNLGGKVDTRLKKPLKLAPSADPEILCVCNRVVLTPKVYAVSRALTTTANTADWHEREVGDVFIATKVLTRGIVERAGRGRRRLSPRVHSRVPGCCLFVSNAPSFGSFIRSSEIGNSRFPNARATTTTTVRSRTRTSETSVARRT